MLKLLFFKSKFILNNFEINISKSLNGQICGGLNPEIGAVNRQDIFLQT